MIRYIIWGTGRKAEELYRGYLLTGLSDNFDIIGFVDNDIAKWNKKFHNINIYMPSQIKQLQFDFIDIWVLDKYEEIQNQIKEIGVSNEKVVSIFEQFFLKIFHKYKFSKDVEVRSFLENMKNQRNPGVYSYNPMKKHEMMEAFYDKNKQLYYVLFEEKKLYLASNYIFTVKNGKKYINNVWQEQDPNSPHLYEQDDIVVEKGDVLVDAGVCEGNFSLHNIEKVSKLYLIESDPNWIEALKATFEPYLDKVIFCNKFLSDRDTDTMIKLNSLIDEPVNFIKMDIEGEEIKALKGSDRVFTENKDIKCSICAYHKSGNEKEIKNILNDYGMKTVTSRGYMLFIYDDEIWKNPELRRGVVRGIKRGV